ncbi:hypothetical protein LEP1GSC061_4038 [Leptospira wolffii serovar Khorat str. Khorat-H2]|nr:hypothetical protein LEP1GSC061_4038 [Leptospira wolffii serovar Khorat str. Khorat-H2]
MPNRDRTGPRKRVAQKGWTSGKIGVLLKKRDKRPGFVFIHSKQTF